MKERERARDSECACVRVTEREWYILVKSHSVLVVDNGNDRCLERLLPLPPVTLFLTWHAGFGLERDHVCVRESECVCVCV